MDRRSQTSRPVLAEAKKPEHYQDYGNQANNIDESIHDMPYGLVDRQKDRGRVLPKLPDPRELGDDARAVRWADGRRSSIQPDPQAVVMLSHDDAVRSGPTVSRMGPIHRYTQLGNRDALAALDFVDDIGQYRSSPLAQLLFRLRVSRKGFGILAYTFLSQERSPIRSPELAG